MTTSIATAATVIGAGPAGLMAAEQLADAGIPVSVYDAMPAAGRKFLRAGIGGLNLTHAEPYARFVERYSAPGTVGAWLSGFNADALRAWAAVLGIETFVGSSGRVFPAEKKAAPLLRAWLRRLHSKSVAFKWRHRFVGWNAAGDLRFICGADEHAVPSQATVFALGGASWARLGSDGRWAAAFAGRGVDCSAFRPANCGFNVDWSPVMQRHAGAPLKSVGLTVLDGQRAVTTRKGE
ncbi:MAG TPA: TIGR03862 family flavoprotein, partial [Spongiibacteraceae bacterium]|nr:TIGR03862 family flavoprotein [Spongiibacteraceae bacterium]